MLKSQQRIDSIQKKMEKLGSVKIPTKEYKEIAKQIADAEKKLNAVKGRMEKFLETGGDANTRTFKNMQYDAAELDNTLVYAKADLQDLIDTGKAFSLGSDTAEYSNLSRQLAEEQARLNDLASTYSKTQAQMGSVSRTESIVSGFERVRGAASKGFSSILKYAGKAGSAIKNVGSKVTGMAASAVSGFRSIGKSAGSSSGMIGKLGSRMLSMAKTVFIWRVLRSALNSVRSAISDSFGTYLNYDARLKSSIAGLKTSLATLQGSFASAFAPIISAAVPYISTLVNWLITAVNAVAAFIAALTGQSSYKRAVANVSGVGDAAGGAAGNLGDAADAAKELNKELGKYDDLNVIGDTDKSSGAGGSGGSGGGGSADGGLTYEDVEIGSSISDMAEKVKEAWANADFTEIGNILGQKLEDGLLSIPWDGIQVAAQKIGKSVATLINGFVETAGLGDAIGMTVAEAINTGILGVESFSANLHWDSVGQFVADGINGALTRIKWENAINSASAIGSGIAAALNKVITPETFGNVGSAVAQALNTAISGAHSFIGTVDWSNWGKSIASSINTFFADFDWKKAGVTFSDAAKGLLNAFTSAVSNVNWTQVAYKVRDFIGGIDWRGILKSTTDAIGSIFAGLLDFGGALNDTEMDRCIKGLEEVNKEIERRIENAADWKTAGDTEYGIAEDLADKYFNLAEKEGLTNDEKETMKGLAKKLVETVPDLEKYYNTETGLLDTTRVSVNNLIESLKNKAKAEAAQDALKELYSAQMDAKKAMDESKTTVDELTAKKKSLNDEETILMENIRKGEQGWHGYSSKLEENYQQLDKLHEQQRETDEDLKNANSTLQDATRNYDNLQTEIDEICGYMVSYSTETGTATTKTDKLSESIKNLPDDKKLRIQAILEDESLSLTEKKVKVAAEVTGLTDAVPLSDKHIDNIYANVTKANAGNGVSVSAPFYASSLSNNGKSVVSPFYASSLSNNGNTMTGKYTISSISNPKKKTVSASATINKIASKKSLKLGGVTASVSSVIKGVARLILYGITASIAEFLGLGKAKGGVYSGGTWSNIPQFAAGGIVNLLSGKIAQFASGGAVDHGTVFVAGEKGSEIVGNIGGRTEILNKSQLASVMYSAVLSGMAQAVNGLADAMRQCMVECTNAAIANLGYILENVRSINANLGIPQVAVAGVPASVRLPDVNRVSQAYSYGSRGGNIDINSLADAVAKRVSINIGLENVMNLDGQPVYRKMVDIDYQTFKQTGKGGFEH